MNKIHIKDISSVAKKYCLEIETFPFYKEFFKNVQNAIAFKNVDSLNFENSLIETIKDIGLEKELRNNIFYWIKEHNFYQYEINCWLKKESINYLRKIQMEWEKRIYKSLNSMCIELGISLSVFRLTSDRDYILEKWNILSTHNIDLNQYRPVYAPKDFLEILLCVENPNFESLIDNCSKSVLRLDFISISLKVKSLVDLKKKYNLLVEDTPLLSIFSTSSSRNLHVEKKRISLGERVLRFNNASVTQEFLKCLAPHSLRGKLWAQVLGSEISAWHRENFKNLKELVGQYDMLVDKLIFKDIQLTVCNDDQYFVFEDLLYQVMLCFSRDTTIANIFRDNSSNPLIGILRGKLNLVNNSVIYPPSGVIPFHGFAMYAAPLCYIFNDPVQLYFSMKSLYLRFWFRLHEMNSHEQGMLSLCILFQELLEYHEPQLYFHFLSINIQPIRIVFKWLMRCFSGYLPPEQLLYLWDLILGYDSLEIVSLLATAILSFRKDNLLGVNSLQNIEAILADLSSIQVIPLLQLIIISK